MKVAYFDCASGISGDMALGAFLDAGATLDCLRDTIDDLGLGAVADVQAARSMRRTIKAIHVEVEVLKPSSWRTVGAIEKVIRGADLDEGVRERSLLAFRLLAEAEAKAHEVGVESVRLHETGAIDAVVDIVGTFALANELGVEAFYSSPLPMCQGVKVSEHGEIPLPAPATLNILEAVDAPTYDREGDVELVTPTGAAILGACVTFSQPEIEGGVEGYGAGSADHKWPNVLRVVVGKLAADGVVLPGVSVEAAALVAAQPPAAKAEPAQAPAAQRVADKARAAAAPLAPTMAEPAPAPALSPAARARAAAAAIALPPSAAEGPQPAAVATTPDATAPAASAPMIKPATPARAPGKAPGTASPVTDLEEEVVSVLETNIDDMPPNLLANLPEVMLAAGALEAFITPVVMKKGRSAHLVTVVCKSSLAEPLAGVLVRETSTLGVRVRDEHRFVAARRIERMESSLGQVDVKLKIVDGRVVDATPEYEEVRALASRAGMPLPDAHRQLASEARSRYLDP